MIQFKHLCLAIGTLTFIACNKESHTPICESTTSVTYDGNVKAIITDNCMGCHNTGSNNTDYSSYAKLKPVATSGVFEKRVLIDQTMPKSGSLTPEELNIIKCWADDGYPEK